MCTSCNRREFLGRSMLGGMLLATTTMPALAANGPSPDRRLGSGKARLAVLFTGSPVPPDRSWGVSEQELADMQRQLTAIEAKLGNVELVQGRANSVEETAAILQKAGNDAPVLAINLSIGGLLRAIPPALESGRSLAVFSAPASGHDWMYPFRWRQEGKPVTLFASSDYNDLERAVRLLRVGPLLRQSRVLVFEPFRGTNPACSPEIIKTRLGVEVVIVPQERFDRMLEQVDAAAVEQETDAWWRGATRVVEPQREEVRKAARVSLVLQRLMAEENAQGLAVGTCMGWLARGFPCLGFTRLRDAGLPAACEGDMDSLLTMLLFQYAFEIPGFQGNSTFDTARNRVWTAHCVGPLKMDGAEGPAAPYLLRSHSEIGGGVVPEIQYRLGQPITRAKLVNLNTLLVSIGTIREVPAASTRACRTQIVTEVADAARMVRNWGGGVLEGDMMTLLHRVVFYGDHRENARHLADLLNLRLVEEG